MIGLNAILIGRRLLCLAAIGFALAVATYSQPLTFKGVWYRPHQGAFIGQLADDTGPSPTPREAAIETLEQNFWAIRYVMNANTVIVRLPDDDDWQGKWGGGKV
jgi:hypothetical protein